MWPERASRRGGASMARSVSGSHVSTDARGTPDPFAPPTTRTEPFPSSVAVCRERASRIAAGLGDATEPDAASAPPTPRGQTAAGLRRRHGARRPGRVRRTEVNDLDAPARLVPAIEAAGDQHTAVLEQGRAVVPACLAQGACLGETLRCRIPDLHARQRLRLLPAAHHEHPAVRQHSGRGDVALLRQGARPGEAPGRRVPDLCPREGALTGGASHDEHAAIQQEGRGMPTPGTCKGPCAPCPVRGRVPELGRSERLDLVIIPTNDQHPAVRQQGRGVPAANRPQLPRSGERTRVRIQTSTEPRASEVPVRPPITATFPSGRSVAV